jgi:hypothetical protein
MYFEKRDGADAAYRKNTAFLKVSLGQKKWAWVETLARV